MLIITSGYSSKPVQSTVKNGKDTQMFVSGYGWLRVDFGVNAPTVTNDRGQKLIMTSCLVASNEGVGFGVADCSPSDTFNEKIGQRIALTRGLARFSLTREQRIAVFKELGLHD